MEQFTGGMSVTISRREYEERYGEEVGYCRRHGVTVVDDYCPDCEDAHREYCDQEGGCAVCDEHREGE